jgi:hypothetical protein
LICHMGLPGGPPRRPPGFSIRRFWP